MPQYNNLAAKKRAELAALLQSLPEGHDYASRDWATFFAALSKLLAELLPLFIK